MVAAGEEETFCTMPLRSFQQIQRRVVVGLDRRLKRNVRTVCTG